MEQRKISGIGVCLAGVLMILLGITYAFIDLTLQGAKKQVITAGSLKIRLDEGDAIVLENALPMYDEVGMIQKSFSFTLYNESTQSLGYKVYLEDVTSGEKLSTDIVRYAITKDKTTILGPDYLSTLKENEYQIDAGKIDANSAYNYELRLWIDEKVIDNTVIRNKSLKYKIRLEATQSSGAGTDDVILAALVDGTPVTDFPTKDSNYGIEGVDCTDGAIGTFKTNNWSFVIENFQKTGTTCTARFSTQITPEESDPLTTTTKEELQEQLQNVNDNKNKIVEALTNQGITGIDNNSSFEEIVASINANKIIVIGSSTSILNNTEITGGWTGATSVSYNYSSTPSVTSNTKNLINLKNVKSVQASFNFGYYVDSGKTESARFTLRILDSSGNVVASNYATASQGGYASGSTSRTVTVDTSSLNDSYLISYIIQITQADGSHVTTSSSITAVYLLS